MAETIEQFLARGGNITEVAYTPPKKSKHKNVKVHVSLGKTRTPRNRFNKTNTIFGSK